MASRAAETMPPPVMLLLAIISIQMGSVLAVQLFPALGPIGTVFLRVGFAAALLAVAVRPAIVHAARHHAALILLFGFVIAAMNLSFFLAIARIPLGIAASIEFLGPITVAVLTTRRPVDFLWVALAVIGIGMLTPDIGAELDPLGILFAGFAAGSWAAFMLLSPRVARVFSDAKGLSLGMIAATALLLPLAVIDSHDFTVAPIVLLGAFGVAILSTAIPLTLEYEALKRMPPRTYGMVITIEPVIAMILGALLLGDSIGPRGLIAVFAVMSAALGATIFSGTKANRRED